MAQSPTNSRSFLSQFTNEQLSSSTDVSPSSSLVSEESNCITTYRDRSLDKAKMQKAFVLALNELRDSEAPIVNNELKNGFPISDDGDIPKQPLTLGEATSIDLNLLDPLERKVLQAVKDGEGTFRACAEKYGFTCACSRGETPFIGYQSQYGIENRTGTLVPYTDPNDQTKKIWRYMKATKWSPTFECPCFDDDTEVTLAVFGSNTIFHPKIAKSVDEIMREIIYNARFEWFKQLFKDNKWNVTIGSRAIFLCLICKRTSIYGDERDIKGHMQTKHKCFELNSQIFKSSIICFFSYKKWVSRKRGLPKNIDAVINQFLEIELFPNAEMMARSFLKEKNSIPASQSTSNV